MGVREVRAAREEQARLALRGLPTDEIDDDADDEDPEDEDEAEDLNEEDEKLASVAPTGSQSRWESEVEATQEDSVAATETLAPAVIKSVWTTDTTPPAPPSQPVGDDEDAPPPEGPDIFCVRHSPDDTLIAAGGGDGIVRIFHADGGRLAYTLDSATGEDLPTTCIRFRPSGGGGSKTRNVLLVANCDGTINHWHVTSKKLLHTVKEENNQTYALDYARDGGMFASAGRDYTVRLYDEATKTCVASLASSFDKTTTGHSNRVFAVKFSEQDPNTLLSGGWDNTLQVWDVRQARAAFSMWGAHICGDAIDVRDNTVLTGSWRPKEQLQMWDLRTGEKCDEIGWGPSVRSRETCHVYGAQLSKNDGALVAAGGSGANELKIFSRATKKAVGSLSLPKGVYGLDFANHGKTIAIAAGDSSMRVVAVPE